MNTELSVTESKSSRLDDSLFSKELAPHYMQLATKLASSSLVPKSFQNKPQDLFLCWAMGYQIGISPEQSMQCIAVINGRPCMWGDDMLALCMTHKDFQDITEEPILNGEMIIGYTCTVKRKGVSPKTNVFTLDMAKKAGLLAKGGVWTQYPERMLKLRARGFTLRDAFPDALKGIKSREEVEDYIEAEYQIADGKDISRTELLKKDYLTKTGKLHDKEAKRLDSFAIDKKNSEETDHDENIRASMLHGFREEGSQDKCARECTEDNKKVIQEKVDLHSEVKRLIDERGFTEERLNAALKYYEADSIENLSEAACEDFIQLINKPLKEKK